MPVPTTTGVTVRLLVVDGIPARKAATAAEGDPPPETVTGVTVTPEAVVMPVTAAVATVTAVVAAEVRLAADWPPGSLPTAGLTFSLDLSRLWLVDGPLLLAVVVAVLLLLLLLLLLLWLVLLLAPDNGVGLLEGVVDAT